MATRDLALSERERFILDALLEDSSRRAQRRARIILDRANGKDEKSIAHEIHSRPYRVRRVLTSFQEKRLESFSAAARKRVSGSVPQPAPPAPHDLSAQTTMHDAAREILSHQFSKLTEVEKSVRDAQDIEAVHDMRVAARRINSALRLFKKYLPRKRVKKIREVLERLRDALGSARNLDVLLENLHEYRAKGSAQGDDELQRVVEAWTTERTAQQHALVQILDSAEYDAWKKRFEEFLHAPAKKDSPTIAQVVPELIWQQYSPVRVYEGKLDTSTLQELHALRIDLKRLRYTLEFFADAFGGKPSALIDPLVKLQDQLGVIQDAVVARQKLTDFIAAQADAAKRAGEAIQDFQAVAIYHAHLNDRIQEYCEHLAPLFGVVAAPEYRHLLAENTARL